MKYETQIAYILYIYKTPEHEFRKSHLKRVSKQKNDSLDRSNNLSEEKIWKMTPQICWSTISIWRLFVLNPGNYEKTWDQLFSKMNIPFLNLRNYWKTRGINSLPRWRPHFVITLSFSFYYSVTRNRRAFFFLRQIGLCGVSFYQMRGSLQVWTSSRC